MRSKARMGRGLTPPAGHEVESEAVVFAIDSSELNFLVDPQEPLLATTETRLVRACHAPRQLIQNHPSGHIGGWATPWSAEEMLDGQRRRVDVPPHARTAHDGLVQEGGKLEEDLC